MFSSIDCCLQAFILKQGWWWWRGLAADRMTMWGKAGCQGKPDGLGLG